MMIIIIIIISIRVIVLITITITITIPAILASTQINITSAIRLLMRSAIRTLLILFMHHWYYDCYAYISYEHGQSCY